MASEPNRLSSCFSKAVMMVDIMPSTFCIVEVMFSPDTPCSPMRS